MQKEKTKLRKNSFSRVNHRCELCRKTDPSVKEYAEDFELQSALAVYLEEASGEKQNVSDISWLCEDCYEKIRPD